jgi:acetylornithine deacetylase/succinyl-diaminopimelate desuccinylase-like protein
MQWRILMDTNRAFQLIDAKLEKTIERLRRIVGVNTVVPPGANYDVLVDYLEPQFKAAGFATERVVVPPERWHRFRCRLKVRASTWSPRA